MRGRHGEVKMQGAGEGRPVTRMLTCLRALRTRCSRSPRALADLFGSETSDSVETEAEDQPVLFSQAHVEARKLRRHGTTVPAMAQRHGGADQRAVAPSGSLLKVEKERRAAKQTLLAVAQKH